MSDYDWREDLEHIRDCVDISECADGCCTYFDPRHADECDRLAAYIERLEADCDTCPWNTSGEEPSQLLAERDALLAEHEAVGMMLPLCGLDWKQEGWDDPCDVCSLPPVHAAHDHAENLITIRKEI